MGDIAQVYAQSLFDLALENNQVEDYLKDIKFVDSILESEPSFIPFFTHVLVPSDAKIALLDKCFREDVNQMVLNFLKLLVRKRRIRYIKEIVDSFIKLCNKHLGIEEGKIYSAFDLSDAQVAAIEEAISKKENKKVILRVIKDESLIGGVRVQVNTRVYDGSVKNKVSMLRKSLLESR